MAWIFGICLPLWLSTAVQADSHVPNPGQLAAAKSAPVVTLESDQGGISILRVEGDYNRRLPSGEENTAARQAVAQELYSDHSDLYDFVVAFTSFDIEMNGARGFYTAIQNDIDGIGLEAFDYSAAFGSDGRLQGFIDMGPLDRWSLSPQEPGFEDLLATLSHELMHRWCCYVDLDHPQLATDSLIGFQGSHWSDLLDSGASLMFGHDWQDQGDGTFLSSATQKFFSPLDMYLAGWLRPDQVADFALIDNPALDPDLLPDARETVEGVARTVSVQDIIGAEGPRSPSAQQTDPDLRMAFVLLARPGEEIDPVHLVGLERLRREFATRFGILTAGRARIDIYPGGRPDVGGPTGGTSAGEVLSQADPALALDWLRGQQSAAGAWWDTANTDLRDTQVTFGVLSTLDPTFAGGPEAIQWLQDHGARSTDDLARRILALAGSGVVLDTELQELRRRQNEDGGWGAEARYASDSLDTALALRALLALPGTPASVIDAGIGFLTAAEQSPGGWSSVAGGPGRSTVTTEVLHAFQAAGVAGSHPSVPRAVTWLAARQNPDGGFGDSPSSVHDTANVLGALLAVNALESVDRAAAESYLASRQQVNGSWDGSVYATALAVRTLRSGGAANFAVDSLSAAPSSPRDGERVTFSAAVSNLGGVTSPVTVSLFQGDPAAGGTLVQEITVPDLRPAERRLLELSWNSFDQPGSHLFVLLADAADQVAEASELDNRAELTLTVEEAPLGAELEARPGDIQIIPPDPDELPAPLSIFLNLRNLGQQDAQSVRVRLWRGTVGDGVALLDQVMDLPGRSQTPVQLLDDLEQPGTTLYTLELDADQTVAEADETDNVAAAQVITRPNLDLEVTDSDLRFLGGPSGGPAVTGVDLGFEVDLRNRGTLDLERNIQLHLSVQDGQGTQVAELPGRSIFLTAGEQQTVAVSWRAAAEGDYALVAELDLSGTPILLDSNADNHLATLPFSVGADTQPNLLPARDSWILDPTQPLEGAPLTVRATVENAGQAVAASQAALFDGHPDSGSLIATVEVPALAAGESVPVSFLWSVPDAVEHTLFLRVDNAFQHAETSENDNLAFLSVRGLSLPDAAVSAAALELQPSFPRPGDSVTLRANLTNLGEQGISNLVARVYAGTPSSPGTVLSETTVPALPGSAGQLVSLGFVLPQVSGNPSLFLSLDPDGSLSESSRANNTAVLSYSVQDGDIAADPRYFSPDGDGVQDDTTLFLRLGAASTVTVQVESEREGEVVRSWPQIAAGAEDQLVWDGRGDAGGLVDDGSYVLRVTAADGTWLGETRVTVDTNRSPLLDAVGTSFLLDKNLTCDLPDILNVRVTDDEEWVYFRIAVADSGYPAGVYRMGLDGSALTPLVTLPANEQLAAYGMSANGATIRYTVDPPSGPNRSEILTLDGHSSDFTGIEGSFVTFDAGGEFLYTVTTNRMLRESVYDLTAGAETVADLVGLRQGWSGNVSADRGSVAFNRFDRIYLVDLLNGTGAQAPGLHRDLLWSWDGRRLAAVPVQTVTGEGGLDLTGSQVAIYHVSGALERVIDLPLDVMPAGLYDAPNWDPEAAGRNARLAQASWDAAGERLAIRMEYEVESSGILFRGQRFVVAEVDSGAVETVAWSVPFQSCACSFHVEAGGREVATLSLGDRFGFAETTLDSSLVQDGELRLRLSQAGPPEAWVERVQLWVDGSPWTGMEAHWVDGSHGEDPTAALSSADGRRINLHGRSLELVWRDLPSEGDLRLRLLANEAGEPTQFLSALNQGAGKADAEGTVISSQLVDADRMLWVPHNEALALWTPVQGKDALAAFFSGSRVPLLSDKVLLDNLRGSATGHYVLYEDTTWLDAADTCAGDEQIGIVRSLANLTADLRVRRNADGTAVLEGTAADAHFKSYVLEYASVDSPEQWSPIAPASASPVFDDVFQPWSAPAAGNYLVRLTVEDLAGNRRSSIRRVAAEAPNGVTDIYQSPAVFSPNGDGQVDVTATHYRTLGPWVADVSVQDESGQTLRTLSRVHDTAESASLEWDGRDAAGQVVPDGIYRLRFGALDLFARTDTRAPALTLRLIEPYTIYNEAPILKPILIAAAVKDRQQEQIDAWVEWGEGENPGTWQPFVEMAEVDPASAGDVGEFGGDLPLTAEGLIDYINTNDLDVGEILRLVMAFTVETGLRTESVTETLGLSQVTGLRYRARAEDEVANGAVLASPAVSEKLMLFGLQDYVPGGLSSRLSTATLKQLILQSTEGFNALPVIRLTGSQAHFSLGETVVAELSRVDLQYRQPGAASWATLPISQFLLPNGSDGGGITPTPSDGLFDAVVDLSAIVDPASHELRLRAVDADDQAHVSKRFRVGGSCPSLDLVGILENLDDSFPAASCVDAAAIRATLGELVDELAVDTTAQTVVWGWERLQGEPREVSLSVFSATDPAYFVPQIFAPAAARDGVMVFLPDLGCDGYSGNLSATGEVLDGSGTPITVELTDQEGLSLGGSCATVTAWAEVVAAESCDQPPPGEMVIGLRADGEDLDVLRLETEAGQILFNQAAPVPGLRYEHRLSFDDFGDGILRLQATVQGADGRVDRQTLLVPVDRTAPTVEVISPSADQTVCGYSGGRLPMDLLIRETLPATAAELLQVTAQNRLGIYGEPEEARLLRHSAEFGLGAVPEIWTAFQTTELIPQTGNGELSLSGRGGLLPPLDAQVSTRFEVVGWGGHRVCAQRSFTVDTAVQAQAAPGESKVFFSPNGDGFGDTLPLPLAAGPEPVWVDLEIFGPTLACNVDGSGAHILTAATDVPVPGASSIDWNGNGLADGLYSAFLVTRDSCGNEAEDSVCVVLDTQPPVVSFLQPQAGSQSATLIDVEVSVSEAVGVSVSYGVGSSPASWRQVPQVLLNRFQWNTFGLAEGEYTLRAVAVDPAGNRGEALLPVTLGPRQDLISYLEASPALFSPNGDGALDSTAARFGLTRAATVTLEVRQGGQTVRSLLDQQALQEGADTVSWQGRDSVDQEAIDGTYQLWMRAESMVDGLPVVQIEQVPLTLDTQAPALAFESPVADGFIAGQAGASASVEEIHPELWTLSLAEGAGPPVWQVIAEGESGPVTASLDLQEGPARLRLEARDRAGNTAQRQIAFTVDSTAPVIALTAPEPGAVVPTSDGIDLVATVIEQNLEASGVELRAVAENGAEIEIPTSLSGSAPQHTVTAHWLPSGVADGIYQLRLRMTDRAGLSSVASLPVVVDGTAPEAVLLSPTGGSYITEPGPIVGTASDLNLRLFELHFAPAGSGAWSPLGLGTDSVVASQLRNWSQLPADGEYDLRLRVQDLAGATSEASVTFHIDTHPPAPPTGLTVRGDQGQALLSWNAAPEPDVVRWRVLRDGVQIQTVPASAGPSAVDPSLGEGRYAYSLVAEDAAGQVSEPSAEAMLEIDFTPPTVSLSSPSNDQRVSGLVDVQGSAYAPDLAEYRLWLTAEAGGAAQLLRSSPVPVQVSLLGQWNTLDLADNSRWILRLEAEDLQGNTAHDEIVVTVDNAPPAAPTALDAQVTGAREITVQWQGSPDSDVAGYLLYRNGDLANADGPVVGDLTPYLISGTRLVDSDVPDGTFTYVAYAMDQAGNLSVPSNQSSATVENGAPHALWLSPDHGTSFELPLELAVRVADIDQVSVRIDWRPQGGSWTQLVDLAERPFTARLVPTDLSWSFGDFELQAVARDGAGNQDANPPVISVTYGDVAPPTPARGLAATVDGDQVTLNWDPHLTADGQVDADVAYHVERLSQEGWQRLTTTALGSPSFQESNVAEGLQSYSVVAVDLAGNEAARSDSATARIYSPELSRPFSPTRQASVSFSGKLPAAGQAEVSVQGPTGTSTWSVAAGSIGNFNFPLNLDLLPELGAVGGLHTVTVVGIDGAGQRSKAVTVQVVRAADPGIPSGLVDSGTGSAVELAWDAGPELDLVGYRLFRNGESVLADGPAALTSVLRANGQASGEAVDGDPATAMSLSVGETVTLPLGADTRIPSITLTWGRSAQDPNVIFGAGRFRLQAAHGPDWVTLVEGSASEVTSTVALADLYVTSGLRLTVLEALSSADGPLPVSLAEIRVIERPLLPAAPTAWAGSIDNGVFSHQVSAVNAAGFESLLSLATAERTVGDVVPPAPPVLAGSAVGSDVHLNWQADAEAVLFRLYRDGVPVATTPTVGTVADPYVDAGRMNGSYTYRASAEDAAGNVSDLSNEVTVTVAAPGPNAPSLVSVSVNDAGQSLEILGQEASGGPVANSFIFKRGAISGGPYAEIGRVNAGSAPYWSDTNVVSGVRYYYVLVAVDALGNESPTSNELSGLVVADASQTPSLHSPTVPGRPYVSTTPTRTFIGRSPVTGEVSLKRAGQEIGSAEAQFGLQQRTSDLFCLDFDPPIWPSSDGRYLWLDCLGDQLLVDFESSGSTPITTPIPLPAGRARWLRHSLEVIYTTGSGEVSRYHVETGVSVPLISGSIQVAVPSIDGEQLAVVADREGFAGLWTYDLDEGQWTQRMAFTFGYFDVLLDSLAWSHDDRFLSWIRGSQLEVLDLQSGQVQTVTHNAPCHMAPHWSPVENRLFYAEAQAGGGGGGGEGEGGGGEGLTFGQDWLKSASPQQLLAKEGVSCSYQTSVKRIFDAQTGAVIDPNLGFYLARAGWAPDGQDYWVGYGGEGLSFDVIDPSNGQADQLVFGSQGNSLSSALWNESGYFFFMDGLYAARIEPRGRFEVADVPLVEGENLISAAVGAAQSEPLTVIYGDVDGGGTPDPADLQLELFATPVTALLGDSVRITAVVRNLGPGASLLSDLTLVVSGEQGFVTALADGLPVSVLAAGGSRVYDFEWTPETAGDFRLVAAVDVSAANDETDESNNGAQVDLRVLAVGDGPEATLSTDSSVYSMAQTVHAELTVLQTAAEPWSGTARVEVVDADGFPVASLGDAPVTDLEFGESVTLPFQWATGATFAGDYSLVARLLNGDQTEADTAVHTVNLLPTVELELAVAPDQSIYVLGSESRLDTSLSYTLGNVALSGGEVRVRIADSGGMEQLTVTHGVGTLLPGGSGAWTDLWTAPELGTYSVTAEMWVDGELRATATGSFQVVSGEVMLEGELTLTSLEHTAGEPLDFQWSVQQTAGEPVESLGLIWILHGLNSGMEETEGALLSFDGTLKGRQSVLTRGMLPDDEYTLRFWAFAFNPGPAEWQHLDSTEVTLTDRSAPRARVVDPIAGEVTPSTVNVTVEVSDDQSMVERTELRLDDGFWIPALESSTSGDQLTFVLTLASLAEGEHTLQARTVDSVGNSAISEPLTFRVDSTPPQIEITGVDDGGVYGSAVTPVVSVTDLPVQAGIQVGITLDGLPFESGALVGRDGLHELRVSAQDEAAGSTVVTTRFTVDLGDPELFSRLTDELILDADDDGEARGGDRLRYQLEVINLGVGSAADVSVVVPPIPHGLPIPATTSTNRGTILSEMTANEPLRVEIDTLAPGAGAIVTFEVDVDPNLRPDINWITAQGRVSATGLGDIFTDDPDTEPLADRTLTEVAPRDSLRCLTDEFDELMDPWQWGAIGHADQVSASAIEGVLRVAGTGQMTPTADNAAFVYRPAYGDFRIEVDLADVGMDLGGLDRSGGLMARSSLDADAAGLMVRYTPPFPTTAPFLRFDARRADGGIAEETASRVPGPALPVRVALTRRGDRLTASYLRDGIEWEAPMGATVTLPMMDPVWIGPIVTAGHPDVPFSFDFDNLRLCRRAGLPLPPPGSKPLCRPDQPLDIYYLLDLSDPMRGALEGGRTKLDAARDLVVDLHQRLVTAKPNSRASLVTFAGRDDPPYNLSQSVQSVVPLTADLDAVAAALSRISLDAVRPESTKPIAIAVDKTRRLVSIDTTPERRPVLVWLTDGVPDVDRQGRGPDAYRLSPSDYLSLYDLQGLFRTWGEISWWGGFNYDLDTFDGEPFSGAMSALDDLAASHWQLTAHGVSLQGNDLNPNTSKPELLRYGARATGGSSHTVAFYRDIGPVVDELFDELVCQEVHP